MQTLQINSSQNTLGNQISNFAGRIASLSLEVDWRSISWMCLTIRSIATGKQGMGRGNYKDRFLATIKQNQLSKETIGFGSQFTKGKHNPPNYAHFPSTPHSNSPEL